MTEPAGRARNRQWERAALLPILAAALGLRLYGIGFGLPALNDPDEPLFVMTALEMLRDHSLNPHWFGHPGTLTLYGLALVAFLVGALGIATGRFADGDAFVAALYADPGIVFLPGRLIIAAAGIGCVWLTWRIGRQIGGARLGLLAAALLALNPIHIAYSQLIRTDVQASFLMLLATQSSIALFRHGRWRDYMLAAALAGLACATKWPAAVVLASPLAAGLLRARRHPEERLRLMLVPLAAATALFAASPYLLLDWPTVAANLAGEARPRHPGATGGTLLANLGWYLAHPLRTAFGPIGLALALGGTLWIALRSRLAAAAVLPGFLLFGVAIAAQALVWERWIVPLLPLLCLGAAQALLGGADLLRRATSRRLPAAEPFLALLLAVPMAQASLARAHERTHDTRQAAAAWVRTHLPPGRSILVEHAAFDLLAGPWRFRFPVGSAGCIDARAALGGRIRYSRVETLRTGRPTIDLGNIDPARLEGCRTDIALLTNMDRYAAAGPAFAPQYALYRRLLAGGRVLARFDPMPGVRGGPPVVIVALAKPGDGS